MKTNRLDMQLVQELTSEQLDSKSTTFQVGFILGQFAQIAGESELVSAEDLRKDLVEHNRSL